MRFLSRLFVFIYITSAFYIFSIFYNRRIECDPHSLTKKPLYLQERRTTIVTAYYPFQKTKHTHDDYYEWLTNLMAFVENPMVIFTNRKHFIHLYKLRNKHTNKTLVTVFILNYSSPLEMPPVKRLENVFRRQSDIDPEKSIHSVDLYAIWCAKSYMLNLTSFLNPFKSTYFIWIDAGSFRSCKYRFVNWPDPTVIIRIFNNPNRILLSLISPLRNNSCYRVAKEKQTIPRYDLIEGGIIGGSLSSIRWWANLYYETVEKFITMNEFVGKDQHIMNYIALAYPSRINVVLSYKAVCDDNWFVYGPLLANNDERDILFGKTCQNIDLKDLVQPLDEVCLRTSL